MNKLIRCLFSSMGYCSSMRSTIRVCKRIGFIENTQELGYMVAADIWAHHSAFLKKLGYSYVSFRQEMMAAAK